MAFYYPEISSPPNQETGITVRMDQGKTSPYHGKARPSQDSMDYQTKGKENLQQRDCPFHEGVSKMDSKTVLQI